MDEGDLQGALRILYLLNHAGSPPADGSHASEAGAVAVVASEMKIHALDFWMRNSDYLAHEILVLVENGELDMRLIDQAEKLLEGEEPELRHYPMLRYRFGAYEPIDNSISYLIAAELAGSHRFGEPGKVQRTEFYLFQTGRDLAEQIGDQYSELEWYPRQAGLVALVGRDRSGSELKNRQYELAEYAQTNIGSVIQPITHTVREKLIALRGRT